MRRAGCSNCGVFIYFRGNSLPLNSEGRWDSGYVLEYANNGYFWIGKAQNGLPVTFIDWTYRPYITSNWNTLKVTANGNYLQFFINGHLVAYGTANDFSTGRVGIGFWRDTSSTNHLYVDWATLNTTAPSSLGIQEDAIYFNELDARVDPGAMEGPNH